MTSAINSGGLVLGLCIAAGLSLMLGAVLAATVRALGASRRAQRTSSSQLESILSTLDLSQALVETSGDGLILVKPDGGLDVVNCPDNRSNLPSSAEALVRFENWIEPADAQTLRDAVKALGEEGKAFTTDLRTASGTLINAEGRPVGARLILRLRDLSRLQRDFAEALHMTASFEGETRRFRSLLNSLDFPIWTADADGLVSWSNDAFRLRNAKAAKDRSEQSLMTARSVIGTTDQWHHIDQAHADGQATARADVLSETAEQLMASDASDLTADQIVHFRFASDTGQIVTAGYARPQSPATRFEQALERMQTNQAQTLNALRTAVCVFSAERQLTYYNEAFAQLFGFQRRILDERPHESTVLTYIKSTRQMPESGNHRGWREPFTAAYTASEPVVDDWELHDGRYLRAVFAPNGDGGVIWLFENETEKYDLTSRFAAETQVRKASLDALREGVAVFGSDACLQLVNPSFMVLWGLTEEEVRAGVHVKAVTAPIRDLAQERSIIDRLVGLVGALGHVRDEMSERLELMDDRVIDLVATPLPGGATMVTCNDVTASVAIEDTLRESNAALEEAARIKTAFIKHVSYELRSPLTPIVGFTELLVTPDTGPLNDRQREYLGYVRASTDTLKILIDSILDLATVDAGMLALSLDRVELPQLIDEAMAGLENRIKDARMAVDRRLDPRVAVIPGDRVRLRQVLYNLLSNAVSFSKPGGAVRVRTRLRDDDGIDIVIVDRGQGMSAAQIRAAFEPFETGQSGRGTGAGLGLTLSKALVELHGGQIKMWSREGLGTVVRCTLPGPAHMQTESLDNAAE
ncbi:MAG: ATP-binding protein [Pseudomonadota bacterium]